jgi:hypothetical protein
MFSLSIFQNFFTNNNNFNKKDENSLEKRMKKIIEKDNGKIRHYYKPYIVSLKSKTLLTYINNVKNDKENDKENDFLKDKIDLLQNINEILINVSKNLYNKFDPTMIYTFHNEINLVFFYNENGESIYDGNINKTLTSIVSYASILISKELNKKNISIDFVFDGHFVEFDIDYEILNFLVWRQFQCKRNTITLLYKCLKNKNDINNLTLDDMKYSLPIVSQEFFTGNIIKKRKCNSLIQHPLNNEIKTVEKVRKNICIEYLYFHKNFPNVFEKYIKTKYI